MSDVLFDAAGRRRSPAMIRASTPAVRRATRAFAIPPIRQRSRRSSPSCPGRNDAARLADARTDRRALARWVAHPRSARPHPRLTSTPGAAQFSSAAARAAAGAKSVGRPVAAPGSGRPRANNCATTAALAGVRRRIAPHSTDRQFPGGKLVAVKGLDLPGLARRRPVNLQEILRPAAVLDGLYILRQRLRSLVQMVDGRLDRIGLGRSLISLARPGNRQHLG
jgi:hypothetical protein